MVSDATLINVADHGELLEAEWYSFRIIADSRMTWTDEQLKIIKWAFWAGAGSMFDTLFRLETISNKETLVERINKLRKELGTDPFHRPPKDAVLRREVKVKVRKKVKVM